MDLRSGACGLDRAGYGWLWKYHGRELCMDLRSGACGLDGYGSVVDENCAWTWGPAPVVWITMEAS